MTTTTRFPVTAAGQPNGSESKVVADFDFDKGNFIRDLISYSSNATVPVQEAIAPMDVSLVIRVTHIMQAAWFDALAPYHPTAVGVYSRIARRPSSEASTNRNKNVAGLYAGYQVVKGVFEERVPAYRALLASIGLDPDDESEDRTSPVGIGNIAGQAVVAGRQRDGMNQLGDEGRRYNGKPYEDYTGFRPVNTAFELVEPSHWQPELNSHHRRLGAGGPGDKGIFVVQQFVTPQARLVRPYTFNDPSKFELGPPRHSDHTRADDYKRSADAILEASAALTDEMKVKAEFFDNKMLGIGQSVVAAARTHELDLDGWVHLLMTNSVSMFDGLIAVWHQKTKYHAVRPFSAIRHVYGSTPVTAWGGPFKGTVNDMPANEWASYTNVADHPEYPSISTTLCSAEAQATRRFLGSDVLGWSHIFPAGTTLVEPGLTPASDLELHWDNWTDFVQDCGTARVWGGVHFPKTVETSIKWGAQFGDLAYEYVQRYIRGDVKD